MDNIEIKLPLEKRNLMPVRLFIGGLCSVCGFNLEETEDVKVAVSEALLMLLTNGYRRCKISASIDSDMQVVLSGEEHGGNVQPCSEFALVLVRELIDHFSIESGADGVIKSISVSKVKHV